MNYKWTLSVLLALCTFPVVAQDALPTVQRAAKDKTPAIAADSSTAQKVTRKVEVAVARAQARRQMATEIELDPQILTQAEERLQKDRNAHSGNAKHSLSYYYNQIQAEQNQTKVGQKETKVSTSAPQEHDPYFLYRAEELLQKDRNAHNGNATHTLDYYYQQVINE